MQAEEFRPERLLGEKFEQLPVRSDALSALHDI
jgi:hypothetical protein